MILHALASLLRYPNARGWAVLALLFVGAFFGVRVVSGFAAAEPTREVRYSDLATRRAR